VRWRGQSSETLLVLRFIIDILLILTHLILVLRCNENVLNIDSLDFFRFMV
jgi:hypothetical protein